MWQTFFSMWFYGVELSLQVKRWVYACEEINPYFQSWTGLYASGQRLQRVQLAHPNFCTWRRARAAVTSRCLANIYCSCYCCVGRGMCWITQWFFMVNLCFIMSDFPSADCPQWTTVAEFEDVTWGKSPSFLLWVWHYSILNICSLVQKKLPDIHTWRQQVHPLSLKTRMSMGIICKSQNRRSDLGGSGTET